MKNLYLKIVAVIGVTSLSVWFIPGVDDGVELFFQLIVLVASSQFYLQREFDVLAQLNDQSQTKFVITFLIGKVYRDPVRKA